MTVKHHLKLSDYPPQIYELARGAILFDPFWNNEASGMNPPQTHLAQMTGILGDFPLSLVRRGTESEQYFDEFGTHLKILLNVTIKLLALGHLKKGRGMYNITFEELLARAAHPYSAEDIGTLADFLRCGLSLDPEQRWSARCLLRHPWLESTLTE